MQSSKPTCNETFVSKHFSTAAAASFEVPLWLRNPHLQTLWTRLSRYQPTMKLHTQCFDTADGDFVDLAWSHTRSEIYASDAPLLIIFHGLEGSAQSAYVDQLMHVAVTYGWQAVVMQFRSCSGRLNRTARAYHSGDTGDARAVIEWLYQQFPQRKRVAAGFSLGGNMLVKLLGESPDLPLDAAACISAPLALAPSSERINQGFSRFYRNHLLNSLKHKTWQKMQAGLLANQVKLGERALFAIQNFQQFDHEVTAPLHGFQGVDDYYQRCSGLLFLPLVRHPLLVIHAEDDPFTCEACVPAPEQLGATVRYELYPYGGHVGFFTNRGERGVKPWLPNRLIAWFAEVANMPAITLKPEQKDC